MIISAAHPEPKPDGPLLFSYLRFMLTPAHIAQLSTDRRMRIGGQSEDIARKAVEGHAALQIEFFEAVMQLPMFADINRDQIKSLEASIIEALKAHDCDPKQSIEFAEQCFAAKRLENLQENIIKWLQEHADFLQKDNWRYEACISNLRAYIDYLEKEKDILEQQLDQ